MARVLLGVTGGIAAYKACELCRLLVKDGHDVIPLLTPGAERFVTHETLDALARRPRNEDPYPHLERADVLVIAPLTANTMAKLAYGIADSVLTEAALAHRGPVLVAPAMNPRMWAHPATQENAETLCERGVELVGPEEGETAEGEVGVGRMSEPETIHDRIRELLSPRNTVLLGEKVLVTAGGTREPLDSVRYVGNRSSGRMGVALAEEAARRGAEVTLVASNLAVAPPVGVELVDAPTAEDVLRETLARPDAALVLMAAAVADYTPADPAGSKRPKDDRTWSVELVPTEDVLRTLGESRNGRVLVGFAANEGERGLARAREKLAAKGADMIVFNDVARTDIGFDAVDNEVVVLSPDGAEKRIPKAPKARVAAAILDEAERMLEERRGG
jgi:phosphopantothenoylcysteine decarboxylase / phosphopantothenate---cysteine ligase